MGSLGFRDGSDWAEVTLALPSHSGLAQEDSRTTYDGAPPPGWALCQAVRPDTLLLTDPDFLGGRNSDCHLTEEDTNVQTREVTCP